MMLAAPLILAVVLVPVATTALTSCSQFVSVNTSVYPYLFTTSYASMNFSSAWTSACQGVHPNSTLAIFRDVETQNFSYFHICGGGSTRVHWIGFNHSIANPTWTWYDGVTIGLRNNIVWGPGQPGQNPSCADIGQYIPNLPYLDDDLCSNVHLSICELNGMVG
jgi:hypothetical protein